MSKFKDFIEKAVTDDAAKKEILAVLGDEKLADATDKQLEKVSEIAKMLGVEITAEELKTFASGDMELDDEELEAVAGGWDRKGRPTSYDDWYQVAREVNECGIVTIDQYGTFYGPNVNKAMEIVAPKYHVDTHELWEAWFFFWKVGLFNK